MIRRFQFTYFSWFGIINEFIFIRGCLPCTGIIRTKQTKKIISQIFFKYLNIFTAMFLICIAIEGIFKVFLRCDMLRKVTFSSHFRCLKSVLHRFCLLFYLSRVRLVQFTIYQHLSFSLFSAVGRGLFLFYMCGS